MKRFIPLAGLCLAVFLIMTGMGMAVVALPSKFLASSGTLRSSGWLASCFALSYMLCQYPAGRLADRFGYREVLACGCLLMAIAAALMGFAETTGALYLGRFLQGAGEAPVWASAPALLARLYPGMKGRVMGMYNASFHLGLMLGPVMVAGHLVDDLRTPFLAFSGLCLVAMILVLLSLRNTSFRPVEKQPRTRLLVRPGSMPVFCSVPVFGAIYGLLVSCFPVYLTTDAGFSPERLGLYYVSAYAGIAASQLASGALSDRYGRVRFMVGGLALLGCALIFSVLPPFTHVTLAVAAIGLGAGSFATASMAFLSETCDDDRKATVSGYYYLAWGSGYFAGPLLVDHFGVAAGSRALALCSLAMALLIAWRTWPLARPTQAAG
ncbi:MAG: hypothetical protein CVU73_14000 [Deltaproteobacteria bacterium HGW-Deltaproteobacteria-8]|jgi:MFS family permease|nr:MAG: hypothetical protein CVU73_14000 [Deltaproteobacteria bacterium HGW-Deltaproteobacteria-8]